MTDQPRQSQINADHLEAALASIPLAEISAVQPFNLAKRLIRLWTAVEVEVRQQQMRRLKEPAT